MEKFLHKWKHAIIGFNQQLIDDVHPYLILGFIKNIIAIKWKVADMQVDI